MNSRAVIRTTLRPCWLVWQNCGTDSTIVSHCRKALGEGLFELRHVGRLNTRVFWFFMKKRKIILVHGIRNKGLAIPPRDLATARDRMHDWRKRVQP